MSKDNWIGKPDIKWKPKEVTGDILAKIAQESADVSLRGAFSPEDQEAIDNYIDSYNDVMNELDDIENGIKKELKSINFPLDKKKNPLAYQALRCPRCGRVGATSVTYDDIEKKYRFKEQDTYGAFGLPDDSSSSSESQSKQEQKLHEQAIAIFRLVAIQILGIVLKFLLKLLSFMEYIPILGKLYKGIKVAVENILSGKDAGDGLSGGQWLNKDGDGSFTTDDLSKTVSGTQMDIENTNSLDKVTRNILLPMACIAHNKNFENWYNAEIQKDKNNDPFALTNTLKNVHLMKENIENTNQISRSHTDLEGYETLEGNKLKKPQGGAISILNKVTSTKSMIDRNGGYKARSDFFKRGLSELDFVRVHFIQGVRRTINQWWRDPETLCCLIRNLALLDRLNNSAYDKINNLEGNIGLEDKAKEGIHNALLMLKLILTINRDLLSKGGAQGIKNQILNDLSDMSNIISTILQGMVNQLYGIWAGQFFKDFNKHALSLGFLQDLQDREGAVKCVPWLNLTQNVIDSLKDIINGIHHWLMTYWSEFRFRSDRLTKVNLNIQKVRELDFYINLIDAVISFNMHWNKCLDEKEKLDLKDISQESENFTTSSTESTTSSTESKEGKKSSGLDSPSPQVNLKSSIVTKDDVFQILTNYMGESSEFASKVTSSLKGEQCCDNTLTSDQIENIKKSLGIS